MHWLYLLGLCSLGASNLLVQPDFTGQLDGWKLEAGAATIEGTVEDGAGALHIQVPKDAAVGWPRALQDFPCVPGALYEGTALGRGQDISGGYGVYLTLEFLDAAGKRITYFQSNNTEDSPDWMPLQVRAIAPPDAASGMICLVLNGHGDAWFRSPAVKLLKEAPTSALVDSVTLEVSPEPLPSRFLGMGFEDDGWFYNRENAAAGVDAADIKQHEERIRFMDPDMVRMFFWYKDWNPSGDWKTFDWESDNMQSRYRALSLYQELGTAVNVTGVEWGVEKPFSQVEPMAQAIVALLEHLIKDKGFTCIKYWTLTNEPNGTFIRAGGSFEGYVRIHTLVKQGIQERKLGVQVVGSDDTNGGFPWFTQCVNTPEYFEAADVFASHQYIPWTALPLSEFFLRERLELLHGRKPFIVAEFGFQDPRSGAVVNPLMSEFDYALWTTDFALQGLNLGVNGFSIWCLNEVLYPSSMRMTYGLWDYKDNGWKLRPVFHAWALLTSGTEPGQPVRTVASDHEDVVRAAVVGDKIFWVCLAEKPVMIALKGATPGEIKTYTASDDLTLLDPVTPVAAATPLTLPARSFGVIRLRD